MFCNSSVGNFAKKVFGKAAFRIQSFTKINHIHSVLLNRNVLCISHSFDIHYRQTLGIICIVCHQFPSNGSKFTVMNWCSNVTQAIKHLTFQLFTCFFWRPLNLRIFKLISADDCLEGINIFFFVKKTKERKVSRIFAKDCRCTSYEI